MVAGPEKPSVPIVFDGRRVSSAGAALAGGIMINSIDTHDGHRLTMGHVECCILPIIFACISEIGRTDARLEVLTSFGI